MIRPGIGGPAAILLITAAGWPNMSLAQDDAPGLFGTLSFSQRIAATDNPDFVPDPDGSSFTSRTALDFALQSVTRTETLSLSLGTSLSGSLGDDEDPIESDGERANLSYERIAASSSLSLGATYRASDLSEQEVPLIFTDDFLLVDGGSVRRYGATARLATGIDAPFGLSLGVAYNATVFQDAVDPDATDSERLTLDGTARFRLSPVTSANATVTTIRTEDDDPEETVETFQSFGLGAETALARGLTLAASLSYDRNETETLFGSSDSDGIGFTLSASQALPRGSIGTTISSRVSNDGRLTRATVDRSVDLKSGGLAFSVGVVDLDGVATRPTAEVNYTREGRSNGISAVLTQTPSTDGDDVKLNTALRLDYEQSINSISGLSANVAFSQSDTLGSDEDVSQTRASVSYRRDLTEAWDLRAGYSYRLRSETGEPDRDENSVFLSLERDFSFGF